MSSESIKKQRERAVLSQFRALYPQLPRANIIPSERPDFLLEAINGARLGIELTQLHEQISITPETETLVDQLLYRTGRKLDAMTGSRYYVSIIFNEAFISAENLEKLSDALLELIVKFAPRPDEFRILDFPELGLIENYPFINRILLHRFNEAPPPSSILHRPRSLWLGKVDRSHVERSLLAKEKKYPHYREHANQVWLLIELNGYFTPTQSAGLRHLFSESYASSFERVFILNSFENTLYPLHIAPPAG